MWHKIEDGLPEKEGEYLVYTGVLHLLKFREGAFYSGSTKYRLTGGDHWTEVPKLPDVEEEIPKIGHQSRTFAVPSIHFKGDGWTPKHRDNTREPHYQTLKKRSDEAKRDRLEKEKRGEGKSVKQSIQEKKKDA